MAEARVVKLYIQVGYVKFQHKDDKSPLKGAWSGPVTHFKLWRSSDISGTA